MNAAGDWPADHVERRQISALIPYARNSNTHPEAQIAQIAASMREWGWTIPVLIDEQGTIIAGHCRVCAAQLLKWPEAPVMIARNWSEAQKRAYVIADNRLAQNAGWDTDLLSVELDELRDLEFDLDLLGFQPQELNDLIGTPNSGPDGELTEADAVPDVASVAVTALGDVWRLGDHRLMCGDSAVPDSVALLMSGEKARLLHADPPYGMGKEIDGVLNDNLYGTALDEFQMSWWRAWRPFIESNASVYIWGNAPDLWRLWYRSLEATEPLTLRNEIVWDKKSIPGMASPDLTQYPEATERCLFFQLGRHVLLVNQTKEDYWEGWEPIRSWLCAERERAGFSPGDVKRICANHMNGHWFGRSQWVFISRDNYSKLAAAAAGKAFTRPYDDLLTEYRGIAAIFKGEIRDPRAAEFRAARPYFDNTHSVMHDVWDFPRVVGEERHEHATPKPVEMIERVMRSSLRDGELALEPFIGSGSTLIAAHRAGRRCYGMELDPRWVDVTVKRWQAFTGQSAVLDGCDRSFDEIAAERFASRPTRIRDEADGRLDTA
jgi:DNA modification methylase